ncbi:hypothetical protein GWK08_06070 [Leptobacterium flavescens]|uniref:Uncharacterized protein n=1 Tax=Leptobacterium flavescens TaxID=472055 RepID=A0A6P0UJ45_9FLAO|nr:hypothetical protein [Leptobacterium flavescens]NER12997.1 hypothetical protein [Leptobacterium flavescens]
MKKAKNLRVLKLRKVSIAKMNYVFGGTGEPSGITIDDPGCNTETQTGETGTGGPTSLTKAATALNTCIGDCNSTLCNEN